MPHDPERSSTSRRHPVKRTLKWVVVVLAAAFIVIQFFRPDRTNPPSDPSKSVLADTLLDANIGTLFHTACFDCHSNETRWPWYSSVAPVSWLVADDVRSGRRHLNFSEWGTYPVAKRVLKLGQIFEQVTREDMPLPKYLMLHPDARLTNAQRDSIAAWTQSATDDLTGGE